MVLGSAIAGNQLAGCETAPVMGGDQGAVGAVGAVGTAGEDTQGPPGNISHLNTQ